MAKKKATAPKTSEAKRPSAKRTPVREKQLPPPPIPLSMVLCDQVHRDPTTGKPYLMGCFATIGATSFPIVHPSLSIFLELTNGRGKVPFRIQVVDVNEDHKPICVVEQELEFDDPRLVGQLDLRMVGLKFPKADEYRVQVFACGEFLVERRITVVNIESLQR